MPDSAFVTDPARVPVLLGVGEAEDRPAGDAPGLDPAALALAALHAAEADGGGSLLADCDRLLLVPQISFPGLDVAGRLARALGLPAGRVRSTGEASGDTPVRLLAEAANAIGAGEASVCGIAGGEALRTAARRAAASGEARDLFAGSAARASPLRRRYGVVSPVEIYPFYENALRCAWGQTLAEGQAETGAIWSAMSEVAAGSPGAWLRRPYPAAEIVTPSAANRPVAFPYTKLMTAHAGVNQGAALIVTSLAVARARGLAGRAVFLRRGASAHEAEDPLARADWRTPPSMRVAIAGALSLAGVDAGALDHVELYSCFPCVPKMARRLLGRAADRPVTVHGGLTFGGGPIGDYMTHAAAAMARRLRAGGRHGLLFANGGHCTHNHAVVLSREAPAAPEFPHDPDRQAEADAARGPIPPLTDAHEGPVRLETYTVLFDRDGAPARGIALSRAPDGARVIARVPAEDADTVRLLTDGAREPVGMAGHTVRRGDRLHWRPGAP